LLTNRAWQPSEGRRRRRAAIVVRPDGQRPCPPARRGCWRRSPSTSRLWPSTGRTRWETSSPAGESRGAADAGPGPHRPRDGLNRRRRSHPLWVMPGGPPGRRMAAVACRACSPRLSRPIRRWSSMRTFWMVSRRMVSATRNRRAEPSTSGRRTTTAWLLAGLVLSLVLALSGCGAGGGSDSATRPSTERSGTRPDPSGTESPSETTTEPTRPTRTPTSAERPNSPTTTPATSAEALAPTAAPTPSAAGAPAAAAESEGLGALGWTCSSSWLSRWLPAGCSGDRAGGRPGTLRLLRWSRTLAPPPAPSCRRS